MKTTRFHLLPLRLLAILAIPLLLIGCEHDSQDMGDTAEYMDENAPQFDSTSGTVNESERPALSLSPASAAVSAVGDTVAFVAAGGTPPYEWGVGNSVIGSIQVKNGNPCVYIANQLKQNSVFVKDARGAVVAASIEVASDL